MEWRLAFFLTFLISFSFLQWLLPRRPLKETIPLRWSSNLSLAALNSILILPFSTIGGAYFIHQYEIGLFNWFDSHWIISFPFSLIFLDFLIYWQHRLFHRIPQLWRFHRVHHTDLEIDASTGIRFHPVEILLSVVIKLTFIALLGIPVQAVIAFEIILNGCSIFNHSNLRLPLALDHLLRKILITPDMHRVHHSRLGRETNSNYGFCLSFWDFLFQTTIDQPKKGHMDMTIGVNGFNSRENLIQLIKQPWRGNPESRSHSQD